MDRSRVIYLISITYSPDSIGQMIPVETKRKVYAEISSVTSNEFFTAGKQGLKAELRATVFAPEYNSETLCEVDGKRYGIYRTYMTKGENLELYLERKVGV